MLLRYVYDENLAQASYFVGCQETAEAIVVDPARDIDPYMEIAQAEEMRIVAAAETHIHADFVSGSRELAERIGVKVFLSDCGDEDWKYANTGILDQALLLAGDVFWVGNLRFETLHSPGHTPEHISFLLTDTVSADEPMGLFSGDFVFVGDVGRPDLLETAANIESSAVLGARQMFHSLQRFRKLPDFLQVWPGHGAGSACGRELGAVPTTTVGYEEKFNWAFAILDEDTFVKTLLVDQPETPNYFAIMKIVNKEGPALLSDIPVVKKTPFHRLESILEAGLVVVDARPAEQFSGGHIPGTINIPSESSFANWAGWLLNYDQPFYLICDDQNISEVTRNLAAVGLDNCAGYLDTSSLDLWVKSGKGLANYQEEEPSWVMEQLGSGKVSLIDVRSRSEWKEEHIPGAVHIMLGYLRERLVEIPPELPVVLHCQTGVRSSIAASILKAQGFEKVINLRGGIEGWKGAGFPTNQLLNGGIAEGPRNLL